MGCARTHRVINPTHLYIGQNELSEIEWVAIDEMGEVGEARSIIHFERLPALEAEYLDTEQPQATT